MVGVSLVLRLAGWAKTLQPGELERWQRAIGRTWRGFLAAMTGLTLYGELKQKSWRAHRQLFICHGLPMDEQAVGTPQCDWIETDYSFPFSYVSRDIERMGITTAFVQGKSDTRPKTSIHETFPISWEWKNVSLHHSFAVSWTQLLIKCDYSVCNGKTVRSVRVQKVLVAHQKKRKRFRLSRCCL